VIDSKAQNNKAIVLEAFETLTDLHPGATPEQVQAPTGWNLKTTDPFTPKWDHHTKRKNRDGLLSLTAMLTSALRFHCLRFELRVLWCNPGWAGTG
jgi:hypothetical protein